jgi:hypothetical protein
VLAVFVMMLEFVALLLFVTRSLANVVFETIHTFFTS